MGPTGFIKVQTTVEVSKFKFWIAQIKHATEECYWKIKHATEEFLIALRICWKMKSLGTGILLKMSDKINIWIDKLR